jgi:broad specificity phosphatase PhoE
MHAPGILLFVLRHGQTDYNAARRFQGQSFTRLNEEGRAQARRTGEIAANLLAGLMSAGSTIAQAVTSDLPRASETADIVARVVEERLACRIEFEGDPTFRELNIGDLQDFTVEEYERDRPGFMREFCRVWEQNPYDTRYPGEQGESRAMVAARVAHRIQALNRAAAETPAVAVGDERFRLRRAAKVVIWSTHGAVIDVLLELLQADLGKGYRMIGNGDLLLFEPAAGPGGSHNAKGSATRAFAERHGCGLEWMLLRHYRVGDSVAARIRVNKREEDDNGQ